MIYRDAARCVIDGYRYEGGSRQVAGDGRYKQSGINIQLLVSAYWRRWRRCKERGRERGLKKNVDRSRNCQHRVTQVVLLES